MVVFLCYVMEMCVKVFPSLTFCELYLVQLLDYAANSLFLHLPSETKGGYWRGGY